MKNFPSALIRQQSTKNGLGDTASSTLKNIATKALSNIFGGGRSQVDSRTLNRNFEIGYTRPELEMLVDESNISASKSMTDDIQNIYNSSIHLRSNLMNGKTNIKDKPVFEDPFKFSSSIFSVINNYKYVLAVGVPAIQNGFHEVSETEAKITLFESAVVPSLFNPYAGIMVNGIKENIPLIDREISSTPGSIPTNVDGDLKQGGDIKLSTELWNHNRNIGDCSIKTLVELSQGAEPELGLATYRYADFMFCKDLGKIPNNHLITLRKFPVPIGDNIFKWAHPKKNHMHFKSVPDIGRLITWFDNEDNKLEDICRYNYHATWKEFTAEIQQVESQEQDNGWLSKIANMASPQNNKLVEEGYSGNYGALQFMANTFHIPVLKGETSSPYFSSETLTNYDKHKIYEPQDRIWSTHKYEGKLEFNQEINLTFRYVLRSYSNINPRAAMLDLLGNIHTVTYRRGSFWGGETKMYGPQTNTSIYNKAYSWIDNGFDKVGGIWEKILGGEWSIEQIQNYVESAINEAGQTLGKAVQTAKDVYDNKSDVKNEVNNGLGKAQNAGKKLTETAKKWKVGDAIKGMLKNTLGRPAIYAINSLLTGEEVGPWHLTVGNPRNPIMSIGNLIMEDSEIQHYGPLGIDDFPTELRVTVKLKHAMPRDSVGIQKMYTQGMGSIYKPMNLVKVADYSTNNRAFGDVQNVDNETLKVVLGGL